MGSFEKQLLTFLMIIVLSLSPSCTNSIHDHDFLQEEYGYDFRSYPSYFRPVEEGVIKFGNISKKIVEGPFSGFRMNNFSRRSLGVSVKTVNVISFGAKGDGSTDDTKAFQNAWKQACASSQDVSFVVPQSKTYLLKPLKFSGSCKSHITMEISGTILASDNRGDYSKDGRHWLIFDSVDNLVVEGGGTINGNGNVWWQNSCKINKSRVKIQK